MRLVVVFFFFVFFFVLFVVLLFCGRLFARRKQCINERGFQLRRQCGPIVFRLVGIAVADRAAPDPRSERLMPGEHDARRIFPA